MARRQGAREPAGGHRRWCVRQLCARHSGRLSKWYLVDSLELLGDVQRFCEGPGCASHDEFRRLTESLLVAIDRIQAWVDRMIPWHTLDANLELVP